MFSITEIIELAVQIEKNGERSYRRAQQEASDDALRAMLGVLAEEEGDHQQWFRDLKNRIISKAVDPDLEEMARGLFQGILGEKAFALDELNPADLSDLTALLQISAEFERDTVLFYEMLEPFMEEAESRDHLKAIIEEEKGHIGRLRERIKNLL
jgi:rubrerythrin